LSDRGRVRHLLHREARAASPARRCTDRRTYCDIQSRNYISRGGISYLAPPAPVTAPRRRAAATVAGVATPGSRQDLDGDPWTRRWSRRERPQHTAATYGRPGGARSRVFPHEVHATGVRRPIAQRTVFHMRRSPLASGRAMLSRDGPYAALAVGPGGDVLRRHLACGARRRPSWPMSCGGIWHAALPVGVRRPRFSGGIPPVAALRV
jgi:hypothetical protein